MEISPTVLSKILAHQAAPGLVALTKRDVEGLSDP